MRILKYICVLMLVFSLIGCQSNISSSLKDDTALPKKELKQAREDKTPKEIANHLVELATRIEQVNDATAIVFGDYAIVGIDVDAKLDRSHVGTVKYSVAESLKEDPYGAIALVTADPDIGQRIREISAKIRRGQPIKAFADELSDIVARIMPLSPRPIPEKKEPPAKNTPAKENTENELKSEMQKSVE